MSISTAGSELLSSSVSGLKKFTQLVRGNSISGVRESTDILKKRIVAMQNRLDDLRLCESSLKNRLYASVDQKELELRYGSEGTQTLIPKSSLEAIRRDSNPDHSILFDKNKLRDTIPGFKEIETELNLIETEIKDINRRIRTYTDMIKDEEEIEDKDKPPIRIDIEKDRTTRMLLSYLYFLKNLAEGFKKVTIGANKETQNDTLVPGQRGFSTSSKDEKKLVQMREMFKSYIRSIGKSDPSYITGDKKMNLEDIGDDKNLKILNDAIDNIKFICAGSSAKDIKKLENTIDKFTSNLLATANDPDRSKGLNSVDYYTPEKGDILSRTTTNLATMMANTGSKEFWTKWDKLSEAPAWLARFVGYSNKCLGELPPCPASKIVDPEADARAKAIAQKAQAVSDAAKKIQDEQAKVDALVKADQKQSIINANVMELAIAKYKEVSDFDILSSNVTKLETMKARLQDALGVLLDLIIGREGMVSPAEKIELEKMKNELKENIGIVKKTLGIR